MMKKFINGYADVASEALEGFASCFSKIYRKHSEVNGLILRRHRKNKVALVIGGGSGHEPMFSGFVGYGLGDAAACGNIFASPDPGTVYKTAKEVATDKGILFLYGNYEGDNLNFDMAEEMLNNEGIPTKHIRVWDDCASAPKERISDRRGIAGDLFMIKIAGAACDSGLELEEVYDVMVHARENLRSVGVAATSAHIPGAKDPIFTLPDDEMEYGMGIHGEKGIKRTKIASADEITEFLYNVLQQDMPVSRGEEICVLINGLGSTTLMEMSIIYRKLKKLLDRDGILVYDADLNSYCTTLEMGGFSISFLKLDEQLKKFYDMPCACPYYSKGYVEQDDESEPEEVLTEKESAEVKKLPANSFDYITSARSLISGRELNSASAKAMLLYVAEAIVDAEPMLTKLDSAIGDGDHGIGMKMGMQKALIELINMKETDNAYAPFYVAGNAMLMSMGGASGVIFGSMFLAGAKQAEPQAALKPADVARLMRKAIDAIQERGHAGIGDKTMVDALLPAVVAMEANSDRDMVTMMRAAESAALKGAESTKNFEAKFGRAKTQSTSIGHQDAGATSVWVIMKAMADFVEKYY